MSSKVPPPPGWDRRAVRGENALLMEWEVPIRAMSRRVFYAGNLGMDNQDVSQDLRETLYQVIRRYAWSPGGLPPDAFVKVVLKRRVGMLIRNSKVPYRTTRVPMLTTTTGDHRFAELIPIDVEDIECIAPDEVLAQEDVDAICTALMYAVRRRLTPAAFAALHLRYVEGFMPDPIARATGIDQSVLVSKRITLAKRNARKFLEGIGIETWGDIECVTPEEFSYADYDE